MDKRWTELGDLLVHYSTAVQAGERVMIAMHEVETLPLVRAVYEAAVRAGANVQVQFISEYLRASLLRWGTEQQTGWLPEIEAYGMEWADVYIGLRGAHNPFESAGVGADALARHQRAMGQISAMRWQKTRWCLVRVPGEALAMQAEMGLDELMDQFFSASIRDWPAESSRWRRIAELLERGNQVQLVGRGTDLCFSTAGRKWVIGDGRLNIPDGEIMTAPVIPTVEGHITFETPVVLGGRSMENVRLAWKAGELVLAGATTNEEYLRRVVTGDAGAGGIGEFAFGVNDGLRRFCNDILLDEKIAGTIHIALGRAYPECGGANPSAIHWDMVKDMRSEGEVRLDGRPVYLNGRFIIENEV